MLRKSYHAPPRRLAPSCDTYEACRRMHHRDLADSAASMLRAERHLLLDALARRVFDDQPARLVCDHTGRIVGLVAWYRSRVRAIDAELGRRARPRGAAA
jgi:hypothetical protein